MSSPKIAALLAIAGTFGVIISVMLGTLTGAGAICSTQPLSASCLPVSS